MFGGDAACNHDDDDGGDLVLSQAREEAIARGEDPDAAEAMILNGGEAPVAVVKEPEQPQPQTTGLEGGGLGIDTDVRDAFVPISFVTFFGEGVHRTAVRSCSRLTCEDDGFDTSRAFLGNLLRSRCRSRIAPRHFDGVLPARGRCLTSSVAVVVP